jgi:hypothetical protein
LVIVERGSKFSATLSRTRIQPGDHEEAMKSEAMKMKIQISSILPDFLTSGFPETAGSSQVVPGVTGMKSCGAADPATIR